MFFNLYFTGEDKICHIYIEFDVTSSIFLTGLPVFTQLCHKDTHQIPSLRHQNVYKNTVAKYILYKIKDL